MKVGGGSGIVEKNRSRRGVEKSKKKSVEYLTVDCKLCHNPSFRLVTKAKA
jgi:hypothetical protein